MRKLIIALLLLSCSAFSATDNNDNKCTVSPTTGDGRTVIQCDNYVTIKERDKVTVCNLGKPGTAPQCESVKSTETEEKPQD